MLASESLIFIRESFRNVRNGQKLSGRCKDFRRPLCYAGIQTGGNIDMKKILEIRNLSKSYGRRGYQTWVLRDISLDIFQGDFIGIMGPSGAGARVIIRPS